MAEGADRAGASARSPLAIPPRGWWQILKRTAASTFSMEVTLRCAGVAFFGLMSLFPVIASVVLVYGLVGNPGALEGHLDRFSTILPPLALDVLREQLGTLLAQPRAGLGWSLAASLAVALWSGTRGMNAMIYAITRANREEQDRGFFAGVAISVAMTFGGAVFLLFALTVIAALPAIVALLQLPWGADRTVLLLRWPLLFGVGVVAIGLLYFHAPNRRAARPRWLWPGAVVASALWIAVSLAFALYVDNFGNFEATFGSVAAAVVLQLWLYISALVVTLGASLDAEIEHQIRGDTTVGPAQPMGRRGAFVADHLAADDRPRK